MSHTSAMEIVAATAGQGHRAMVGRIAGVTVIVVGVLHTVFPRLGWRIRFGHGSPKTARFPVRTRIVGVVIVGVGVLLLVVNAMPR